MPKVCTSCSAPIDEPKMPEGEAEKCTSCAGSTEAPAEEAAPEAPAAE